MLYRTPTPFPSPFLVNFLCFSLKKKEKKCPPCGLELLMKKNNTTETNRVVFYGLTVSKKKKINEFFPEWFGFALLLPFFIFIVLFPVRLTHGEV